MSEAAQPPFHDEAARWQRELGTLLDQIEADTTAWERDHNPDCECAIASATRSTVARIRPLTTPSDHAEAEPRAEQGSPVYRVGRSVGRTIYRQLGADPAKGDHLIGVMDTRELAARVVGALNAMAKGRLRQLGDRPEWDVLREVADQMRSVAADCDVAAGKWPAGIGRAEERGRVVALADWASELDERAAAAESRAGRQP